LEIKEMEIQEQVREGVRAVVEPLKDELRKAASDEVASKLNPVAESLTEIRTQLAKLEERGDVRPTDDRVKELEKRLGESEEAIRVIRVSPAQPNKQGSGIDLRGAFVRDVEAVRKGIRDLRLDGTTGRQAAVESRAISSSLFATGGRLPADVADSFIDFLIEQQVTLPHVVIRRMMGPEGHTDELTIAARKMRKATEGTAASDPNAIGTKRRTMNTVEVIWPTDITLTFLEDNIEKAGAEQHIARMIATQFGNDMNDLAWNGDEADTADPFRSINNGWIVLFQNNSDVHDLDLTDTGIGDPATLETTPSAIMHAVSKALPYKFKGRLDLAYTVPVPFGETYADQLSARQTALGDQVMVGGFPAMRYFGRPVRVEPHFVEENADKVVLTPNGNLFVGIQRQMMVESEWQPRARKIEYTATLRWDVEMATGDAVVLASGLPSHLRG
jgi:hypothetical protein